MKCPTCKSPDPKRHPALQFEGEVQVCKDSFHQVNNCADCNGYGFYQPTGVPCKHCGGSSNKVNYKGPLFVNENDEE